MAALETLMTWVASEARWVKKLTTVDIPPEYRKQHKISPKRLRRLYPNLVKSLDEKGTRAAANQFWHDLQAEIQSKVSEPTLAELNSKVKLSKRERALWVEKTREKLKPVQPIKAMLPDDPCQWNENQAAIIEAVVQSALRDELKLPETEVNKDRTFRFWSEHWLAFKRTELKTSSTLTMPHHLKYLENVIGPDSDIATITPEMIIRLKTNLNTLCLGAEATRTQTYCDNICRTIKPFVNYLVDLDKIPPVKNLKILHYKKEKTDPRGIDLADVRKILKNAPEPLRAHLLLMLNCAYTQKDINDIKPSELRGNRLKRKRSKEEDEDNVPEVNYLLFPEALDAIKEHGHKKGERVFLQEDGRELIVNRSDSIARRWRDLMTQLGMAYNLKQIRKTTYNTLFKNDSFARFSQYYCGWTPKEVPDANYQEKPPLEKQDEMTNYLREQFLL